MNIFRNVKESKSRKQFDYSLKVIKCKTYEVTGKCQNVLVRLLLAEKEMKLVYPDEISRSSN